MTTTATRPPKAPRKRRVWILPLGAIIVAFLAFSIPPYLGLDPAKARVPQPEGFPEHYYALLAHIVFGTVAIVSGFLQIWPWFRAKHRRGHRIAGRLYVFGGVIPAGLAGLVVGITSPFGPVGAFSAVVLVSLWLTTTIIGYRRARQRRFADHREWMIRSYTLTASTIVNRFWAPVLAISYEPYIDTVFEGSERAYVITVAGLTSWLSWVLPLILVEGWLIRRRLSDGGDTRGPRRARVRGRSSTG
ncbi:membrane protein, putative [Alloactinosynnema sp. L-07]|uniref:DUF2306 domain-containing protein n=1 Tax=Alloactinosynnema sp. L-07 TaxID=1653480 RepID=UPI00065F0355|nr:DUF2306 domain-containing protein [Alloactinosynnema sp. L-07]CRK57544.1 membrane protein, putative [Alloactinosynnema sp. L-07]